ncbi:hypothetical protein PF008_g28167 [Phytophthora fragariae]|uniref:Uncharacterized protein n=2 Tax=Phytophthora TaxID=4783 RepID=A0A6A3GEW2_9STRA|nr:hypothetical protein PR002_g31804 [Phytophthora rubi]KAE9280295.1 hypothetical protein PF008_g28167 [Phytophthora fragariae]
MLVQFKGSAAARAPTCAAVASLSSTVETDEAYACTILSTSAFITFWSCSSK